MEYALFIFGLFLCIICPGWIRYPDDAKDRRHGIFVLCAGILMIVLAIAAIVSGMQSAG